MKNKQKGFTGIAVTVIIALILVGGGVYYYKKNQQESKSINIQNDQQFRSEDSNPVFNDVLNAANTEIEGSTNSMMIVATGDINNDGYEDAVASSVSCGASCGNSLSVIINEKNNKAYIASYRFTGWRSSGASQTGLKEIRIANGIIYVTARGWEDEANPDTIVTKRFKLEGNSLIVIK